MSTPIYNKKKQLKYIKGRLQLLSYMVDQFNPEDVELKDFESIEAELKKLIVKTKIFHYRNEHQVQNEKE
ncbi:SE1561 family protein [Tepidibacillus infernus]|uniref:Uncharacterized protein n=1 Tax=Tepidibacillus decaturensis TaxID=1413211 RepID=A0A135L187_9BACI|nr:MULTISPECIES: SE1561 family protein [Tepidibacillus]KXG42732.1 hypothetical protein U473_00740 [Tepidibacillus decaturensis]GBF10684.1 hypothetical protein HK1_00697 [Tepidibacillus sp. HK-1]